MHVDIINRHNMKRIAFILLSLSLVFLACSKETAIELVSVSDTGCGIATRSGDDTVSQLILEYSADGLVVTRTNVEMNCSVKTGGIGCNVSSEGSSIFCEAYEKDGKSLRCTCPVEKITSVIKGLRLGKEYIFFFVCDGTFSPISFTYSKDFKLVLDAGLYKRGEE